MKNWKAIVGVILVFVFGMIAGGLVVGGAVARRMRRYAQGKPVFTSTEVTHYLKRKLDLDAAQQQQVLVIVADSQKQMLTVRRDCGQQVWSVISNAVDQMHPVLRADQQAKLDAIVAERRAKSLQ